MPYIYNSIKSLRPFLLFIVFFDQDLNSDLLWLRIVSQFFLLQFSMTDPDFDWQGSTGPMGLKGEVC